MYYAEASRIHCTTWLYLSAFDADDSVEGASRIVKKRNVNGWWRSRYPGTFCFRINVKHVCFTRENWLLPEKKKLSWMRWNLINRLPPAEQATTRLHYRSTHGGATASSKERESDRCFSSIPLSVKWERLGTPRFTVGLFRPTWAACVYVRLSTLARTSLGTKTNKNLFPQFPKQRFFLDFA